MAENDKTVEASETQEQQEPSYEEYVQARESGRETTAESETAPEVETKPKEPAEKVQDEETGSPDAEADTEDQPEEPKKPKSGFQKRIDKLTKRNYELESRLAELEKTAREAQPKPESTAGAEKPRPENFNTYEDYLEALTDWKADQREAQREAVRQKEEQEAILKENLTAYSKGVSEARERYEDFDDVVDRDDIMIPQAAQMAIIESPNGADVAYYLGQHPEVAEELQTLSPFGAVMEIGRISQLLANGGHAAPAPVSKAPAPIRTVSGNSAKSTVPVDEMPYEDYVRMRESGAIR